MEQALDPTHEDDVADSLYKIGGLAMDAILVSSGTYSVRTTIKYHMPLHEHDPLARYFPVTDIISPSRQSVGCDFFLYRMSDQGIDLDPGVYGETIIPETTGP